MTLNDLEILNVSLNDFFAILGCCAYFNCKLRRNYWTKNGTICVLKFLKQSVDFNFLNFDFLDSKSSTNGSLKLGYHFKTHFFITRCMLIFSSSSTAAITRYVSYDQITW